jgi:hypothetical protein
MTGYPIFFWDERGFLILKGKGGLETMKVVVLDVFDASRRLHCHPMSIYRYIEKGLLNAKKIGGEYYIRESDLRKISTPLKVGRPSKNPK